MQFGLFFFAAAEGTMHDSYELLLASARFADERGFSAIWTPERHFHRFGGLYANPAVTGAALAALTSRIAIRAGSVVLPLHHPVRVVEEWAMVDHLSGGRVGVSLASGWQRDDFLLAARPYEERNAALADDLDTVRTLWRGDEVGFVSASGERYRVRAYPRPIQRELPIWITSSGTAATASKAGAARANLLTHLLGQDFDELEQLIGHYRDALPERAGRGHVTCMMHTFLDDDAERARDLAREPLKRYLRDSIGLSTASAARLGVAVPTGDLNADDWDVLLGHAAARYLHDASLVGSPGSCRDTVRRLAAAGVDEIACLIDFGVDEQRVLESLPALDRLRAEASP